MDFIGRIFRRKKIKRDSRVKIQNFHKIEVWIDNSEFDLHNISANGIGFFAKDKDFSKGDEFNIVVKILDKVCDAKVKVVFKKKEFYGCEVIDSCAIFRKYIEEYFESELHALALRKISKDKLVNDANGEPYWFYADSYHEIYYTVVKEKITTFQLNYHGYMAIFDNGVISTGVVWEDDKELIGHKTANLVKQSPKLPKDIMEYSYRFVESIVDMNIAHKEKILDILKTKFFGDWKE